MNLPRNWLHQATGYMDKGELSVRIAVEFLELILAAWLLHLFFGDIGGAIQWGLAFILIHTLNWITNGLFWTVVIFSFPGLKNRGAKKTRDYLNALRERVRHFKCITGVAVYGSVSRGTWHERSDIDVRFLRGEGPWNLLYASIVTMVERFRALLARQPMDLYLADDVDFLRKMRPDEVPLLLVARDSRLVGLYPSSGEREIRLADLGIR